ncbi:hypothetical protein KEM54_004578 [Ascosphaera aggregata]|nr:hypothetical protein KEM54_004578 [Ascosphaera aggregata]
MILAKENWSADNDRNILIEAESGNGLAGRPQSEMCKALPQYLIKAFLGYFDEAGMTEFTQDG